jgi:hypothetical protein
VARRIAATRRSLLVARSPMLAACCLISSYVPLSFFFRCMIAGERIPRATVRSISQTLLAECEGARIAISCLIASALEPSWT